MEREFKAGDRVRIVYIEPNEERFYAAGEKGVLESKFRPEVDQNHWWVMFDEGGVWPVSNHEFEIDYTSSQRTTTEGKP